jgi:hypothetical protein
MDNQRSTQFRTGYRTGHTYFVHLKPFCNYLMNAYISNDQQFRYWSYVWRNRSRKRLAR